MNYALRNSDAFGDSAPPPPPIEFYIALPDGSCIPATQRNRTIVMVQTRSEMRKRAKIKRAEKAAELQCAFEDRAAARRLQRELVELGLGSIRWAATFKVMVRPETPAMRTSPVCKRVTGAPMKPRRDSPRGSSWAVDDLGMKGVIWQQTYLGRKTPGFYRGAAKDNWEYDVRDEAVLLDRDGEPIIISNMGDDWVEIGAAWQCLENASTRANAKIQVRVVAPFDADTGLEEKIEALRYFGETILDPLQLPYSAVMHKPSEHGDQRNVHPYITFSLRPMHRIEPYCWEVADEVRGELDGKDGVQMLRHLWAHAMSEAAERAGRNLRYTGLGYGARGLDLEAGVHLGEARAAMVARGATVWAHERNRIKAARNAARLAIRDADKKIAALTKVRDAVLAAIARSEVRAKPIRMVSAARSATRAPALVAARARPAAAPLERIVVSRSATRLAQEAPDNTPGVARLARRPASSVMRAAKLAASSHVDGVGPLTHAGAPPVAAPCLHTSARPERRDALTAANGAKPAVKLAPATIVSSRRAPAAVPPPAGDPGRDLTPSKNAALAPAGATLAPAAAPRRDDCVGARLDALLHALARARKEKERRAARRLAARAVGEQIMTLDEVPLRTELEAYPLIPIAAIRADVTRDRVKLDILAYVDPYVSDFGDGTLGIAAEVADIVGFTDDQLRAPHVQRVLVTMHAEQREVMTAVAREAERRPLEFVKSGVRFWPPDLDSDHLRRLDFWADDPAFFDDTFDLRDRVQDAHSKRDCEQRRASDAARAVEAAAPHPDGFGGWRVGPPPVFNDHEPFVRIAAWHKAGQPTEQLLMLLRFAGEHPLKVEVASDGKLIAVPSAPQLMTPLLHGWRENTRVAALVTETVIASRAAGQPTWPPKIATAMRSYIGRQTSPARVDPNLDQGPRR